MPCNGRDAFRTTFFVIMSIAARYYRAVSLMSDRRCRYVVTRRAHALPSRAAWRDGQDVESCCDFFDCLLGRRG